MHTNAFLLPVALIIDVLGLNLPLPTFYFGFKIADTLGDDAFKLAPINKDLLYFRFKLFLQVFGLTIDLDLLNESYLGKLHKLLL